MSRSNVPPRLGVNGPERARTADGAGTAGQGRRPRAEQAADGTDSGRSIIRGSLFGRSASKEVSSNINQQPPPTSRRLIFSQEGVGRRDGCQEFLGDYFAVRSGFLQGRNERAPMATVACGDLCLSADKNVGGMHE